MSTNQTLTYHWQWVLPGTPEELWPLVTDTRRINADAKTFERFQYVYKTDSNGIVLKETKLNARGKNHTFTESPFEWEYPHWYQVTRNFHTSPMARLAYRVTLQAKEGGQTVLTYTLEVDPRNKIASWILPPYLNYVSKRGLHRSFMAIAEDFKRKSSLKSFDKIRFKPDHEILQAILSKPVYSNRFKEAVTHILQHWRDDSLVAIRPFEFADQFSLDRKETLLHFLEATRDGLFQLEWRMFCPSCHGSGEQSTHRLTSIRAKAYCPACHIHYDALFDQGIETTFCPTPKVRSVSSEVFCTGGPAQTRHILYQKILSPNEHIATQLALKPGIYGVYTQEFTEIMQFEVLDKNTDVPHILRIDLQKQHEKHQRTTISVNPKFEIQNGAQETLLQIHLITDMSAIATAAEVTSLPEFRNRFHAELLKDGERFAVGSITILFSDVRKSTQLYRTLGDANAIARVQKHFDILRTCVENHKGTVIKTIGDAVMAVFYNQEGALKASVDIVQELEKDNRNHSIPLDIRLGLHSGEAFALTYNQKIDYFGTTINLCSRLEKLTQDFDLVLTENVYNKVDVQKFLGTVPHESEVFSSILAGISEEPLTLIRIRFSRV